MASDNTHDTMKAMVAAMGAFGNAMSNIQLNSNTSQPRKVPTPAELWEGRTMTVDKWFDDFEHHVRANAHYKLRDDSWFSLLKDHCHGHAGMKHTLDQLSQHDKSNLRRLKRAIKEIRFPNGQPQAEQYNRYRYNITICSLICLILMIQWRFSWSTAHSFAICQQALDLLMMNVSTIT